MGGCEDLIREKFYLGSVNLSGWYDDSTVAHRVGELD